MNRNPKNFSDIVEMNSNDYHFLKKIADEQQTSIEHVLSQSIELHIARHMYHCDLVVNTNQHVDPFDLNFNRKNFFALKFFTMKFNLVIFFKPGFCRFYFFP